MSNQNNKFNFDGFNELTERKPAGLQIFLASQLVSNALWSLEKYDNPRATELRSILNDIKSLHTAMKADALARASK
jgi:hypothetical protein